MSHICIGTEVVVGIDISDRKSSICILSAASGDVELECTLSNTQTAFRKFFSKIPSSKVAIEIGTHSPWMSQLLDELGHKVIVANARKVKAIYDEVNRNDEVDAENLARLARVDPRLLKPIAHRSRACRADLSILRSRDAVVKVRGQLISHARGVVKSFGSRMSKCTTHRFGMTLVEDVPDDLRPSLVPILETIDQLTKKIDHYDRLIDGELQAKHPETQVFRQITGVGPITSTAFALIMETPTRFKRNRDVGPYLGLVPRKKDSGDSQPQLRITKHGDPFLRKLLVQSAHYILGPFGPDCDLRRVGIRIAERGGKRAKKRAVVAVARRLAVLLMALWRSGGIYDPLHNSKKGGVALSVT